jgi:hypothetical protein
VRAKHHDTISTLQGFDSREYQDEKMKQLGAEGGTSIWLVVFLTEAIVSKKSEK